MLSNKIRNLDYGQRRTNFVNKKTYDFDIFIAND